MALSYPLVNGFRYAWASIEVLDGPLTMPGIRSINFKASQAIGSARGAGIQEHGKTRGDLTFTASMTMLAEEQFNWVTSIGDEYMSHIFGLLVKFEELQNGTPNINRVELVGLQIQEEDHAFAPGPDGLEITMPLGISYYLKNGLKPVRGMKV